MHVKRENQKKKLEYDMILTPLAEIIALKLNARIPIKRSSFDDYFIH